VILDGDCRASIDNVRFGSRLCKNADVRLACRTSISISSIWESIVLATSFGRRQLRKQFCASFAQARFHTAWVTNGPNGLEMRLRYRPASRHRAFMSTRPGALCGADGAGRNDCVYCALWVTQSISGRRKPIAIQAASSFSMNLPE
jgi:hypothetical protein